MQVLINVSIHILTKNIASLPFTIVGKIYALTFAEIRHLLAKGSFYNLHIIFIITDVGLVFG